jgi:predicted membrane protein
MKRSAGQIIFGLVVVLIGIGFLLDALNFVNFTQALRTWWPLFIILGGLVSLISNPRVILWPLVIIAVGALLQVRELGLLTFNPWSLIWPVVIIIFGVSVLVKGGVSQKRQEYKEGDLDLFAGFSGHEAKSSSEDFKGGKATAIFGGIELDLRKAVIKEKADLEVFAAFGGIEIRVPEGWKVEVSGTPILGGWEDKTDVPKDKNAPVLSIQGTCLCGGVSIKN